MGGWYYINCEMYILSPCPVHPFQTRKGRLSKLEAFERKTPLPVVKKINVKINYWSKVRKPLIAVYLLQMIIIIMCLQSCLKKKTHTHQNSALLQLLSNLYRHKNIPKIKTKPGTHLIERMLLDLTSLFKVRHFGELDPLTDIKYGNQLGLKTVKFCTPESLKAVTLETRVT